MEHGEREQYVQITKVGAGYVYRKGTDYRCADCWMFEPSELSCAQFSPLRTVRPNGYCTAWSEGPSRHARNTSAYEPAQLGYGELPNGTKCGRCKHFNGRDACEIVQGKIDKDACCNNQEPK